jgi:hypothetical protein
VIYGPPLQLQAATPAAGVALVNGTPNIITWTTPSDGRLHRFMVAASNVITVSETGGAIQVAWTAPDGSTAVAWTLFTGNQAPGYNFALSALNPQLAAPGTVVKVVQSTALSVGAAAAWAEIWGS